MFEQAILKQQQNLQKKGILLMYFKQSFIRYFCLFLIIIKSLMSEPQKKQTSTQPTEATQQKKETTQANVTQNEQKKAQGQKNTNAQVKAEGAQGLSKNAQKKKLKQEKLAKEKAEKEEKKKIQQEERKLKKGEGKMEEGNKKEQILDPTQYFQNRSKIVLQLKNHPETNPYPHKFDVKFSLGEFFRTFAEKTQKDKFLDQKASVAGRVTNIRTAGKHLVFYNIIGDGKKLQVFCKSDNHKGKSSFQDTHKIFRRGDIIGVVGFPGQTKTGEFSIAATDVVLLSPCLHMLPEPHVGFKDAESRFRKRYLDLIINDRTRQTFIVRSKVFKFVRKYLDNLNFMQVQTPMMNMIPGGATARPFVTHHNDLNMKLYMRIAPELYLKQLVVGGLDRVFQIGKNFRNQSIDQTHNPEYTSCQFYMAYADYNDLINLTEDMLSKMVMELTGSYIIKFHPDPDNLEKVLNIDFTPPWRRICMMEQLQKCLGEELPKDINSEQAQKFYDHHCQKHHVHCSPPRTTTRLIDKLVGHFLESQCLNPTFIMQHPQLMSPLAKYHRSKPGLTQRFQLFIKYHQFCNAYTQLNDPFVQKELFEQQVKQKEKGDDESMFYDETFVNALQHALPPTAGWGLGIDRTVMLITDHIRIQEVLLFPAMKPQENN